MRRAFRDDHFQRRPHMGRAEVSGLGAAVARAEDDMDMECRFALWAFCNVSNQRGDLDLLRHRDLIVYLRLPIEVQQGRIA